MSKGRILTFDFGLKRTGVAVSDEEQNFAFPLDTISTNNLLNWINDYMDKENVVCFVFGQPMHADDTPADIEPHILGLIKKIRKQYPQILIERQDERYTSKMAFDAILKGGVPKMKRRNKALIDKVSATIILQSYLQSKENQ